MAGVLLGSIQFSDREVPDTINFGGKQVLAIHRLPGGVRVLDAMGPDPEPISWRGLFLGDSASVRARAVDQMRQSGAEVTLQWGSFMFLVVVSDFQAIYKHEWEVRYHITCEVGGVQNSTSQSAGDAIASDYSSLAAIYGATPAAPATQGSTSVTSAMTAAISSAQAAFNAASASGSIENVSIADLQNAIDAAEAAYQSIKSGISIPSGISLDAITGASTLDGISSFAAEASLVSSESDARLVLAYMGRIVGNLTSLGG